MALSERIELLGKGLYADSNIPDILTLKSIPTASELDYVGGEDFVATMLDKIFPQAIEEQCDFRKLLEIDFHWICRALRILNYGPYYTTNAVFCESCGEVSRGEYQADLRTVDVKVLPKGFDNKIVISRDEFIDYNGDIILKLPTIQDIMNAGKDKLFELPNGERNRELARICYMVKSINNQTGLTPTDIKFTIQNKLSSADFFILKQVAGEMTDYGLRAGGTTICPKCGSKHAAFIALVDDRFFRPTLGNLRAWKSDKHIEQSGGSGTGNSQAGRGDKNLSANATKSL